jgi:hypothetical protein
MQTQIEKDVARELARSAEVRLPEMETLCNELMSANSK